MRMVSSSGKSSRKRRAICSGLHAVAQRRSCRRPRRRPFHGTTGPCTAAPFGAMMTPASRSCTERRSGSLIASLAGLGRRADRSACHCAVVARYARPPLRVAALRRSSREIVDGARSSRRAISRTPCRCARQIAIPSRAANDRERPDSGFAAGARWDGGMPPALRNQRAPTAGETPAPTAASSLERPAAINTQNRCRSSRRATEGRPGEGKAPRPDRSERRFQTIIATSSLKVLRRPLEPGLDTALPFANLNLMDALGAHVIHLGGHRVMTITRTTVDAAPDDEVGAELLGRAEQLVDVALAITDMDAPCRRTEQGHGLAQVLQPADALLGLDGHARRIDLALECGGALELLPRPELHGREAQWQTFRRHRKGGVHEKATDRVHPEAAGFVLTAVHAAGDVDRLGALALERELGGVLDHQNGAVRRGEAVARGLEMAGEDLRLADPILGEEAASRLRFRPVLAGERQASPDRARHTLDEFAQALAQTLVHEHASGQLAPPPGVDRRVHGAPHP